MLTEMLVDVGGYRLALYCAGSGTPPVVLDAGGGAGASSWEQVQHAIAAVTQVCAFDRPGIGNSDPVPHPRSGDKIVEEVHTLLAHAGVPGPYVLIGHSSGGLNMRMYARRYPDDVAGLVLVDAVHPDQFVRAAALLPPEVPGEDAALREFREALRPLTQPPGASAQTGSLSDPQADVGGTGFLGDRPLMVLTATQHDLGLPDAVLARLEQDWQAMQQEMVALSSDGMQIIAEGSGHNVHLEHPALVVDAICQVVEAVRRQAPLGNPHPPIIAPARELPPAG